MQQGYSKTPADLSLLSIYDTVSRQYDSWLKFRREFQLFYGGSAVSLRSLITAGNSLNVINLKRNRLYYFLNRASNFLRDSAAFLAALPETRFSRKVKYSQKFLRSFTETRSACGSMHWSDADSSKFEQFKQQYTSEPHLSQVSFLNTFSANSN